MPQLVVNTNVPLSDDSAKQLALTLSPLIATALGKPEQYVAVHINGGQALCFGGSVEPAALCSLVSIGKIDLEHNTTVSKEVTRVLKRLLKIPKERVYITFNDVERSNMGYRGATFANLPPPDAKDSDDEGDAPTETTK